MTPSGGAPDPGRPPRASSGEGLGMPSLYAAGSGSLSLQNIAITVVDLAPTDGIDAGYSFGTGLQTAIAIALPPFGEPVEDSDSSFVLHEVAVQSSAGGSVAAAAAGADFPSFASASGSGTHTSHMSRNFGITVLPNTRLIFTATHRCPLPSSRWLASRCAISPWRA